MWLKVPESPLKSPHSIVASGGVAWTQGKRASSPVRAKDVTKRCSFDSESRGGIQYRNRNEIRVGKTTLVRVKMQSVTGGLSD